MIFKLAEAAEKSWRRLDGHNQLPKVILDRRNRDRQIEGSSRCRLNPSVTKTGNSSRPILTTSDLHRAERLDAR